MIALALGTNVGERYQNLKKAKGLLQVHGFTISKESAIHETTAHLLTHTAKEDWQKNFLNQVIIGEYQESPEKLLKSIFAIEKQMGRKSKSNWAPREIDIDILVFNDLKIDNESLTIPHKDLWNRYYFLSLLNEIAPFSFIDNKLVNQEYYKLSLKLPLWMAVLNINPDSFSDPHIKKGEIEERIDRLIREQPHIIDVGAESTRPNASVLNAKEEWERLNPYLKTIINKSHANDIKVSIDTYHAETAEKAIELGIDIINDVSGLSKDMQKIASQTDLPWVFMHNLGLPADKNKVLPKDRCLIGQLQEWFDQKYDWISKQKNTERFIFDPGLGFGKNAIQSREILRRLKEIDTKDLAILIGHSRKSFLNHITSKDFSDRDISTLAISLDLMKQGVNILRIHNVELHKEASLALQAIY